MKFHLKYLLVIAACAVLVACKKDEGQGPKTVNNTVESVELTDGVFITCEGTFLAGNASVSFLKKEDQTVYNGIFSTRNDFPLGDVLQSIYFLDPYCFLIVNNSRRVEVVNASDFKHVSTISGVGSPRYITQAAGGSAWLSTFDSEGLFQIDPNSLTVTGNIPVSGRTEELLQHDLFTFVTNYRNLQDTSINPGILVFDGTTLHGTIPVSEGPNSMRIDANGKLWVLCDGGIFPKVEKGALYRIDPINLQVLNVFEFPNLEDTPFRLEMNQAGDALYFINKGVYTMNLETMDFPTMPLIDGTAGNFYGLGLDNESQQIYVADPIDFVQQGNVYRYQLNGEVLDTLKVGVGPSAFIFR